MYFRFLVIISTWKRSGPFILTKLNLLHQKMVFAKFGWNWLSGSGEDCYICQFILLFRNYLPSVVQWFGRRWFFCFFLNLLMYFRSLVIISSWKRTGPFIWTNLNPLYPRMYFAKFFWNWSNGSGEEIFLFSWMFFRYFVIIFPRMHCAEFFLNWSNGSGEEIFFIFMNVFSLFRNYLP